MAQLTVTIDNAQVARVLAAFTQIANQTHPSTPIVVDQAWVEKYLKQEIRDVVREYERDQAHKAAIDGIALPPDIT
jgi:hypothetical protein